MVSSTSLFDAFSVSRMSPHLLWSLLLSAGLLCFAVIERATALSLAVKQTIGHEQQMLQAFVSDQAARLNALSTHNPSADIATLLKQSLPLHPEIGKVTWTQGGQAAVTVSNTNVRTQAPAWLTNRFALSATPAQHVLAVSASTGATSTTARLEAWPNQAWQAQQVWQNFLPSVWIWLVAVLTSFVAGFFVLKAHLAGLRELARVSKSFMTMPEFQVPLSGSRDVQRIARTLNAMSNTMKKVRDVAKSKVELSQWYANHDQLTGLPNRSSLIERLTQALARSKVTQEPIALCRINLDDFGAVNDRFGHTAGDRVLGMLADRLLKNLREGDMLARVGGDEFALLLINLKSEHEALQSLERFLAVVQQPLEIDNTQLQVTASGGISMHESSIPGTGGAMMDAHQMMSQATRLMHMAKREGTKQIKTWRDDQADATSIEHQWAQRLTSAVGNGELVLHYQPKVHLRTGEVVGLEALVRWQHPNLGLLLPGAFLPQVEETDAIVLTGKWTLNEALRQMAQWLSEGVGWPVSVNVAARQLTSPDFVSDLKTSLANQPTVDPRHLTIEILETSALEDMSQVRAIVEVIQNLGVSCSLDDFGTGYSSLTYLKQLPVNEVKIDQSFVRGMLDDNGDLAVVEGVVTLCKVFDRQVVAEGVETLEHGALLYRLGCQVMQGWGIAKAMPADKVAAWVRQYTTPAMWREWSSLRWSLNHFPVLVARYDVDSWMQRLTDLVNGLSVQHGEDADENYSQSRLGAWYLRTGREQFARFAGVSELDQLHREMHQLAVQVIKAVREGKDSQAKSMLKDLQHEAKNFTGALDLLTRHVLTQDREATTQF